MDFNGAFEELAFLLATRTLSDTTAPSDVPHSVQNIAQRGIARAARLYNARQIHARVSPALLSMISSRLPMEDRLGVARVCHRWREICMADGTLWADVNTSSPMSFIRWQLEQSASAPLRIIADLEETRGRPGKSIPLHSEDREARIALLELNMERGYSLAIHAESDEISRVLRRRASRLRRLEITGVPRWEYNYDQVNALSHELFTGDVWWPALRVLSVSDIALPLEMDLVPLLVMCPALESLAYNMAGQSTGQFLSSPITTVVPRLRVASFTGTCTNLVRILPYLREVREVEIHVKEVRFGHRDPASGRTLLTELVARDGIDPVVDALISPREARFRLERSSRACHGHYCIDSAIATPLLAQESFFGSLTSLIIVTDSEVIKVPLPAAPVLRTVILLHEDDRSTFGDWQNCTRTWQTPALQTIYFGKRYEERQDDKWSSPPDEDLVNIDRRWLAKLLQDVFAFSADRRLPRLILRNAVLKGAEVEGQVALEDLVENLKVDVVQDLDWDPWATIVSSAP